MFGTSPLAQVPKQFALLLIALICCRECNILLARSCGSFYSSSERVYSLVSTCGNGVAGDNFDEIFLRLLSKSSSCFVSLDCYSRDQDLWTRSTETEPECRLTHKVHFCCHIRIHLSMEWEGIRFGLSIQSAEERTRGICFKLSKVKKSFPTPASSLDALFSLHDEQSVS